MRLQVKELTMNFGGVTALKNVSLEIAEGEILGLIGPNGSGKSTLFNVMTGFYRAVSGQVLLNDENLTTLYPYKITKRGLARTFQNLNLFNNMTVLQNVMVGVQSNVSTGLRHLFFNPMSITKEEKIIREKAEGVITELGLEAYLEELSKNLPYGIQKLVEIARALATKPKFLLLDEPAAGLNLAETKNLAKMIHMILTKGIAVLLVEHNMQLVMKICPRIMVLNYGEKIAEGSPVEINENQSVVEAYLGKRRK